MEFIVTVQPGHLLAPEKRRGQEASGVRPMSNPMKKRLRKQKRACDTLFHGICRLAELLQFINGAERIASIRLHELTAGQAEIFFEQFKNSPFSEPCKTSWI